MFLYFLNLLKIIQIFNFCQIFKKMKIILAFLLS